MTLPVPNLDDRTFQSLVDEAKRRIPEHCPEWTNHNVADPGVALIELFAWMTEIALYRLNQVPDAFYTRMLNLVGFTPFPARAARTDLLFHLSGEVSEEVKVPRGTEVATAGEGDAAIVFTTLEEVQVRQQDWVAALYSPALLGRPTSEPTGPSTGPGDTYRDVSEALRSPIRATPLFARNPLRWDDCFYLGFAESLGGRVLRLSISADKSGRGVIPDNPPLRWEAFTGAEPWEPCRVVADDTGGMNQPGRIDLLVPRGHTDQNLGNHRLHWIRARLTKPEAGQRAYEESPQIRDLRVSIVGGVAEAEHSEVVQDEFLGVGTGEPGQVLRTRRAPVLGPRADDERVVVGTDDPEARWTEVRHLGESGEDDRHYTWDDNTGEIRFGVRIRYPDGSHRRHGRPPPDGARISVTRYRTGGGDIGNVAPGTLTRLRTTIPFVSDVENLEAATGGVDAETVDNAKLRGPMWLRSGGRAVTAADFERITKEAAPSVARVRALPPRQPGEAVRVLVVPGAGDPGSRPTLESLRIPEHVARDIVATLDERRLLGTEVHLTTPDYQGVSVTTRITARLGTGDRLVVRDRCLQALYHYLSPVPVDGRPGWPFGEPLRVEAVREVLESVEGVEHVHEVLLHTYDVAAGVRGERVQRETLRLDPNSLFLPYRHQVVVEEDRPR